MALCLAPTSTRVVSRLACSCSRLPPGSDLPRLPAQNLIQSRCENVGFPVERCPLDSPLDRNNSAEVKSKGKGRLSKRLTAPFSCGWRVAFSSKAAVSISVISAPESCIAVPSFSHGGRLVDRTEFILRSTSLCASSPLYLVPIIEHALNHGYTCSESRSASLT